jgi:streptogramin lyase
MSSRSHMRRAALAGLLTFVLSSQASADLSIAGRVVNLNAEPLVGAMVSLRTSEAHAGADVISVFTGPGGRFEFPERVEGVASLEVRSLEYEQLEPVRELVRDVSDLTIVMQPRRNQAAVAPASAWLTGVGDREQKAFFVRDCVGCHQVPSPAVRRYAGLIASVDNADPALVRQQSWESIVKYMNYLSAWEFGRASPGGAPEPGPVYSVSGGGEVANFMAKHFVGAMDEMNGYDYGAPLIVNEKTVIKEYAVSGANAIREAVLLPETNELWAADVSSNRMYAIDVATGRQRYLEVPAEGDVGPHSLFRDADDTLWITPFFDSVVSHYDPGDETWQTWSTTSIDGKPIGIHDLSFGAEHELMTDDRGRIWYSDIGNNGVGYLDPAPGEAKSFPAPEVPGRTDRNPALYGLVMTSDHSHIWYSQVGIGVFGSFNVNTEEFETPVELPSEDAGPRRLTISDDDIMYAALYGSGQLLAYDTKSRKQTGLYDLPDTGSAPYAATWDPVRKVVWIPTSNGDVIYRFDPRNETFGVLPLPRQSAFLRMIDIDRATGMLITSYANIVQFVHGPRMVLMIDPGDGAYGRRAVAEDRR